MFPSNKEPKYNNQHDNTIIEKIRNIKNKDTTVIKVALN
jgi:hypothetical protein